MSSLPIQAIALKANRHLLLYTRGKCRYSCSFPCCFMWWSMFLFSPRHLSSLCLIGALSPEAKDWRGECKHSFHCNIYSRCNTNAAFMKHSWNGGALACEVDPGSAVLFPECRRPAMPRALPLWVTASFLLWSPWEQQRVFPSKLGGAVHHIKQHCHESVSSATGSLTIAERTAYAAACRSFNGPWFPIWPSWLRYFQLRVCLFV